MEHGIAARAAVQAGVKVLSFGNFTRFGKELTTEHWFHTPDTRKYKEQFENISNNYSCLAQAEQLLEFRLAGGIDSATSYMKTSAYSGNESANHDVHGAVIVFLHDFYDSPHVYDNLIFEDFWSWICFTVEILSSSGVLFYVKPHPNQISLSDEAFASLCKKYPDLKILPSGTSNLQLAKAGIKCGISAYGTVIHELAYLGIPTIACASHPHIAFDFCRTAKTIDEYRSFLLEPGVSPISQEEMRKQALAFVYMHNLHHNGHDLALRKQFLELWKSAHSEINPASELINQFNKLKNLPEFKLFINDLAYQITNNGKSKCSNHQQLKLS
ncbi:hypothetical protein NH8B_3551 [Pseudogulbenkiania sp. NH8B]|nr:hypothetical protein NH8B_3551 [Pseudogulbenkiania sp. NH8B]